MPDELTWFKWEAYATWFSGFALIVAIYYAGASLYLVDPAVMAIQPSAGIAISLTAIVLGWVVYDGLCRSPLGRNDTVLAAVGFVFIVTLACAFTQRLLRARRLHADRRADRHHHGRQRADGDHPRPAQGGRRPDRRAHARSRARQARQAALDPQQLPDAAGRLRDDLEPLSAGLRDALQLGDPGAGARHGRRHPPLLQHAPQGPAEPLVDVGRGRVCGLAHRLAVDVGAGAERAAAQARRRWRRRP